MGDVSLNKTVTYAVTTDGGAKFTNLSAKPTNAGSYKVTVAFDGSNANYGPASDSRTFTIGKADATVSVVVGGPYTYTNSAKAVSSATVAGVNGADLGVATVVYKQGATPVASPTDAGSYDVYATFAGNGNYNPASDNTKKLATGKATTTIVVSGYSGTYDGQAHGATGTARGVSNTDLSSLLSLGNSFTNVPGGTANWSFAGNGNYNPATGAVPITINPQTGVPVADTYYVGSNFYWTTNSTSSNTTLNLVATLKNDPNYNTGVITSARVSFRIRNTDGTFTLINGAQNLPVGLVNAGDNTVGTASTSVPYSITGTNTTSLRIEVVLSGNYRSVATTLTSALITIAVPTPGGLIAGGGKFQVASSTSPQPAGYVKGTGAQFSYFVKYSKSGLNPQGSIEVLVTSLNDYTTGLPDGKQHYYLLKSNSISTLAITNPSAQFTGKANISEVNFDGTQILKSIEGNCTMQLDMVDQFQNPTQQLCTVDQLAITVYRSKGGVWYSSAWNGSKPVLSPVSPKDDITVTGNAGTCGATLLKATTTSTSSSSPSVVVEGTSATQQVGSNLLEVYPAPLSTSGTVHFHTAKSGKAQVYLYDQLGKLVATLHNAEVQAGREYYLPLLVGQLESGVYFCRLIANGKVENRRVMVVK